MPGTVAYGDSRAIESTTFPLSDPESYGSIWAQELAHTLGKMHVSTSHGEMLPTDPNFPYLHGGIGEPGLAIGTEQWNGFPFVLDPGMAADNSQHAHDFMSYGAPNDPGDHTFSWTSPYTYLGLWNSFKLNAQAQAAGYHPTTDKVLITGIIRRDGSLLLRPFQIIATAREKSSGTKGEYAVDLLRADGQLLTSYRFDPREITHSGALGFSELVPWKAGTKRILLRRGKVVLAERSVSPNKPTVRITRPKRGERLGKNGIISWEASDIDGDKLTYSVFLNPGTGSQWSPVATDVTTTSIVVDASSLSGSTKARVRVRATDGVNTTEVESNDN
jgi:hypothetical protein